MNSIIHDPVRRAWLRWQGGCWIISIGLMTYGMTYLTGFNAAAIHSSPSYAAFLKVGEHSAALHGTIQFTLGLLLALNLSERFWGSHRVRLRYVIAVLVFSGVYAGVTALAFLAAPFVTGGTANSAWVPWLIICAFCFWIAALPPYQPQYHRARRGELP
jgi:hypothetical protein